MSRSNFSICIFCFSLAVFHWKPKGGNYPGKRKNSADGTMRDIRNDGMNPAF
ncbi:hypothetical protein HMPREF7215_0210 [Pyramidobacter piscolens W5455]|uniref:Uncharacterized protein n=1 Tax=Pyramidobacter piscolens W5455 TaxID=352165 RepID=A0ABM9ZRF5_9BACT|nr:hypothetical protein HMPREF7215_0210 [Pyramidobacter piscolens W5455]